MDNRSHQETDWDFELLTTELLELRGLDLNLDLTGFDVREIDSLLIGGEDDERADLAPALPEHPVALPGDLWICGAHRVLCGDATCAEHVARLLGDAKPFLMVTDPPYGVEYDPQWRERAGLGASRLGRCVQAFHWGCGLRVACRRARGGNGTIARCCGVSDPFADRVGEATLCAQPR